MYLHSRLCSTVKRQRIQFYLNAPVEQVIQFLLPRIGSFNKDTGGVFKRNATCHSFMHTLKSKTNFIWNLTKLI